MVWVKVLGGVSLASLVVLSCAPYSMTSGKLGSSTTPWTFRTQYAFWDEHVRDTSGGTTTYKKREDVAGGTLLRLRLHGFMFNPASDHRSWNAEQTDYYNRGIRTQPTILASVTHAQKLKANDTVEYDSKATPSTGSDPPPTVSITYYPGEADLNNGSEYPDHVIKMGSHEKVKLKLSTLGDKPGPHRLDPRRAHVHGGPRLG